MAWQWAKELFNPAVQTGRPVSLSENQKSSDDITEDGFVCVGKSSFYHSPEMPQLPQTYSVNPSGQQVPQNFPSGGMPTPYPPGPSTLYPMLPHQPPQNTIPNGGGDNSEMVKRIPFNVRSGLSTAGTGGFRQQKPFEIYLKQFRNQNRERYEYDFNLERGVIREAGY